MAEAFLSVHDMIHAAIRGQGGTASLRQIYAASQARGRIIYKRAGGSRLITSNEHWKSQIRHALYTSGRFRRAPGSTDEWQMAEGFGAGGPSTALIEVSVGEDQRQSAESAARAAARKGGRGAAKPRADRLVATGAPKRTSRGGEEEGGRREQRQRHRQRQPRRRQGHERPCQPRRRPGRGGGRADPRKKREGGPAVQRRGRRRRSPGRLGPVEPAAGLGTNGGVDAAAEPPEQGHVARRPPSGAALGAQWERAGPAARG